MKVMISSVKNGLKHWKPPSHINDSITKEAYKKRINISDTPHTYQSLEFGLAHAWAKQLKNQEEHIRKYNIRYQSGRIWIQLVILISPDKATPAMPANTLFKAEN